MTARFSGDLKYVIHNRQTSTRGFRAFGTLRDILEFAIALELNQGFTTDNLMAANAGGDGGVGHVALYATVKSQLT